MLFDNYYEQRGWCKMDKSLIDVSIILKREYLRNNLLNKF